MSEEAKAIAMSPDSSLEALRAVSRQYPDEVLANAALPLLSLEDPKLYNYVIGLAKYEIVERKSKRALKSVPLERWRAEMVYVTELLFADVPYYQPRPDLEFSPRAALDIAKKYLAGKCSRQVLSWGSRYAQTFLDWKDPKKAPEKDTRHTSVTKSLAEACKACCGSVREYMWRAIDDVLILCVDGGRYDPPQIEARNSLLSRLLEKPAKKPKKKKPCECGQPHCRECGEPV